MSASSNATLPSIAKLSDIYIYIYYIYIYTHKYIVRRKKKSGNFYNGGMKCANIIATGGLLLLEKLIRQNNITTLSNRNNDFNFLEKSA